MAVYKQAKSKRWWYKFVWNGELIRESTKQTNKRVAEQMEAAHRTALAKGEVGIRDRKPAPTLAEFAEREFLPYVRRTKSDPTKEKANTVAFYENCVAHLTAFLPLANARLNEIGRDLIEAFIDCRRAQKLEQRAGKHPAVSTVNRDLATLRRILRLAHEWSGDPSSPYEWVLASSPKLKMLPGENRRNRALTAEEDRAYTEAATELGHSLVQDYDAALTGIRAVVRREEPIKPDAFRLRDTVIIMLDAGLRPEEVHRLTADCLRETGYLWNFYGKTKAARRRIPIMTDRLRAVLQMRLAQAAPGGWLFPAPTSTGHITPSSVRDQHRKAVKASAVAYFEPYILRHTCLTNWAKWMNIGTLHILSGHASVQTTMRYVHPTAESVDAEVKAHQARSGHTFGHTAEKELPSLKTTSNVIN